MINAAGDLWGDGVWVWVWVCLQRMCYAITILYMLWARQAAYPSWLDAEKEMGGGGWLFRGETPGRCETLSSLYKQLI